ncbi:MAG: hypothetical protein QG635_1900, partial [Bacteroidota bacterium]|nr:hypothetical protein [Bacteroidota bacterium]
YSEVSFKLNDGKGHEFAPKSFSELKPLYNNRTPKNFTTMEANVTPRYKFHANVVSDQLNSNNDIEKVVRYYIKKSDYNLMTTTENSAINIFSVPAPSPDQLAGRLNCDSIMLVLKRLGVYTEYNIPTPFYHNDLLDRVEWPERAIDYTLYNTIIWSDGNDKPLSRFQIQDLMNFLGSNTVNDPKKNLIIASQEVLRLNNGAHDTLFTQQVLRSDYMGQYNPRGFGVSNDMNIVHGMELGRGTVDTIKATVEPNDQPPYCSLVKIHKEGQGIAKPAYFYQDHPAAATDSLMGVAVTTLTNNVVYFGVDWRHFGDVELMIRAIMDYFEKNGTYIVPVELFGFEANTNGKSVDLTWKTASELNSAKFEVEKAEFTESGMGSFYKINEIAAQGRSESVVDYGPVTDFSVEYGKTYAYRVKIVDLDGKYDYSEEKVVTISNNEGMTLSQAMPNPAVNIVKFDISLTSEMPLDIEIYDMTGKKIDSKNATYSSGKNNISFDIQNYSSGVYTILVKAGETVITRKFTVVK